MEHLLQGYLNQVMDCMTMRKGDKKKLIAQIRPELEEQLEGHEVSSYDEIEQVLGAPALIAEELASTIPFSERVHTVKSQQRRLQIVILALLLATAITASLCIHVSLKQPGYYTVAITENA